ncbi:hypothetical protein FHS82_000990 [Pseudochelatococcus lubricantis]|uniref:Uncharacterized protein n=1 Tax=Pseudochelatococcus lubricantis TaxID=1538102 RepID=A0ABX0UY03_9HYPH|nr:hypothetical protein [Pseudochelatococcus lubricantis]NIJ57164.1 hypothetical protein [Pseudochelatococcus lubricantis]
MTDKLVERLRKIPLYEGHGEPSSLPEDAADALEAQQARIVELEAEARRWEAGAEAEAKANWSTRIASQGMQARIRALEEALRPLANMADAYDHGLPIAVITPAQARRAKQVLEGKDGR